MSRMAQGFRTVDPAKAMVKGEGRSGSRNEFLDRLDAILEHVKETGEYGSLFEVKWFDNRLSAATAAREITQAGRGESTKRRLPALKTGRRWVGYVTDTGDGGAWCVVAVVKDEP